MTKKPKKPPPEKIDTLASYSEHEFTDEMRTQVTQGLQSLVAIVDGRHGSHG